MRIANHPHGGGMDEIKMPTDQFGERRFGMAFGVGLKQLRVGLIVHSLNSSRRRQNPTENVV